MARGAVGAVAVEFGVGEVEVVVGKEEGVAFGGVSVGEEGGVVGAAADGAFEGSGPALAGVLGGEEGGVGWAAEGAGADEGG